METIIMIEGTSLNSLIDHIRILAEADVYPYRLRIAVDGGDLKIKVDEGVWTPPIGTATTGESPRWTPVQ